MQGTGLRGQALALRDEVGDILATVGAEGVRIVEGAADGGRPVDFGEGHDFLHVMAQVEPAFRELFMIRR